MEDQTTQPSDDSQPKAGDGGPKIKVLMVDDEPQYIEPLKEHLESTGRFEAFIETSPLVAISSAQKIQPDILVLDIVMPLYDGGDVLLMMQKDPVLQKIPVIILSTLISPQETTSEGYVISGGQFMMSKPPIPTQLVNCIDGMLAGEFNLKNES